MKYLRIENNNFGFVTDEIHDILPSDIAISEEDYNLFFEKQSQRKQFRLKDNPSGTSLFDYVEEFEVEPIIDDTPTMEDRVSALEMAMLESLVE